MISASYRISKEEFNQREELKRFYNTPVGRQELCREIIDGCLLSQISTDDQIYKHNLAVRRLERLGVLDEEGLMNLVEWILNRDPYKFPVEDTEEM